MGDAMLVIFPCEQREIAVCSACDLALEAADEAVERVRALNDTHRPDDGTTIECGVAVHVGEVMYGNIGAADRLDFTVIGPAVNEVARVERMCREVEQPLLTTTAFANASSDDLVSLGTFALRGVATPQELFTLPT
jgi:adenylate cyclase